MLKSISCEKLVDPILTFKNGLNSVVGADDAHNSIGKSSVLMLIDFAFGGNDFPEKCDDVIKNVGHFDIGMTFYFDKEYSFIRNTERHDSIFSIEDQDIITIEEFRTFLQEKYGIVEYHISFRECVSSFFRIYQRDNYNDKRPLDNSPKENWISIRKRILKFFNKYHKIAQLEHEKKEETNKRNDIKGTFNTGVVTKISKRQFTENSRFINELRDDITKIKNTLQSNVTDITSIINKENSELKNNKDTLVELKIKLETSLSRIENSLSKAKTKGSKSFEELVLFFPEINTDVLSKIDTFHNGISKIMKDQLNDEKTRINESLGTIQSEINNIDKELLKIVNSKEESVYLLEKLIEADRQEKSLSQQNIFWETDEHIRKKLQKLKVDINKALVDAIKSIEHTINDGLKKYINDIYLEHPISPEIHLLETDYKFERGDDRGTGKGFANMISLDLTFLEQTCLPSIIHDSLLFKNMDISSIENLIITYSKFKKQIFISIDEISKYNKITQELIEQAKFIKLDKDRVAFNKKWKNLAS